MIVGGHGWVIGRVFLPIVVVIITLSSESTWRRSLGTYRRAVVEVIVEGDAGKGGLRNGLDDFTILALQVREVTGGFLLSKSVSLRESLFVSSLDNLGDTLTEMKTKVR